MELLDKTTFKKILKSKKRIVIISHVNPDGDAVGSTMAMYFFLKKYGDFDIKAITPSPYADFLKWMPGVENVIDFRTNSEEAKCSLENAEIIFCVDFNSEKRTGRLAGHLECAQGLKVLIDHHQEQEAFAKYGIADPTASSTAELVYDFIKNVGGNSYIDEDIAMSTYVGLMTDTGSFNYPNTKPSSHRLAAELLEYGVEPGLVSSNIYGTFSESRIKLLGYCLSEKLVVIPELSTSYISLTLEELKRFDYKDGDTEGIVNYGLSVEGIKFTAFFMEREDIIKLSFRSKGNFNVNAFAGKHFNGGGHKNAAGGQIRSSMDEAISIFTKTLDLYRDQLE
ncbi:MAG: bifunctional oligoribonuclease/PAP phosphatase NrnA [Bacteroidota bacterium]|nr:bifunctional oligoribonuclease/PAP phosphatase NrnA [Bacteroidota bacterium]